MTRVLRRALAAAVTSAVGVLVLACPALAGSYTVSACSPSSAAGLWAQTNTFPAAFATGNLCGGAAIGPLDGGNQGGLYAEDVLNSPAHIPDGARAGWTFTAPAGTTIIGMSYYRSLAAYAEPDLVAGLFQADGAAIEDCKIPWPFVSGSSNTCSKPNNQAPYTFTGLNTSSLFLGVTCRIVDAHTACIAGGAPLHAARAALYSAKVTLSESTPPTLSNVGGPLWGAGVVSGVVPVTFAASDATGIQQQLVRSDSGQTLVSAVAPCDFTLAQPCPQQPGGSLSVDTRRVPDGPHTFSVIVTDAAANSQVATSPTVVVHNNRPPAVSTPTGQGAPTASTSTNTPARRTRITAVIRGRRLRVSATIASSGRVRVSWRSRLRGRTVAHGGRMVSIHKHRLAVTFTLSKRARRATTRVAIRSGRRIVAHTRARRS
jgi:hypothetical protein